MMMLGAILGDMAGSIYERNNLKTDKPKEINLLNPRCKFTDDTVLTCAIAEAALSDRDYKKAIKEWALRYPNAGYGGMFRKWFRQDNPQPYNSFGNGSAMRVSPIGFLFYTLEETLAEAKKSAECTHNHPEGIKGAQAIAAAVFMARNHKSKKEIKDYIEQTFQYNLSQTIDEIRPSYSFDVTCQGSVPQSIIAFLESENFVHALQIAISIGGDSDTIACMTGSIAEAYYEHIPQDYIEFALEKMPDDMKQVRDYMEIEFKKRLNIRGNNGF
ncbi:MAG: ADP-ribosylglycohydrolase family protein [Endomicrobium sp.]|jgi:ADP-ribosylglycohydrolase|nr:ADP-ribosylglycohydrolase family protein [Endomicrobium sp.]